MNLKQTILVAALAVAFPVMASAAVILTDGKILIGVDDDGQLNVGGGSADVAGETVVGVRTTIGGEEYESTSHGCLCEGWGVSADGVTAAASNDVARNGGTFNLTGGALSDITGSTATSVTSMATGELKVTHAFAPSGDSADLYRVTVTLENLGVVDLINVGYRRAMDWDASPTPFNEYVSIGGTATTTLLADSSNNGFNDLDMNIALTDSIDGTVCGLKIDFVDCGPGDHGAAFDFAFGTLAAGASYTFDIFYGASESEAEAFTALGDVKAELYSFGRSGCDTDGDGIGDICSDGAPTPTFIFAFAGVGGTVVVDPGPAPIPLPAAGLLLLGGLGSLGAARRLKRRS